MAKSADVLRIMGARYDGRERKTMFYEWGCTRRRI